MQPGRWISNVPSRRSNLSFNFSITFSSSLATRTRPKMIRFKQTRNRGCLFVSSISVVGRHAEACGSHIVPEETVSELYRHSTSKAIEPAITDCSGSSILTTGIGYAKAKLVCESIVVDAAQRFCDELEATCVRVGQVWAQVPAVSGIQRSTFQPWSRSRKLLGVCRAFRV